MHEGRSGDKNVASLVLIKSLQGLLSLNAYQESSELTVAHFLVFWLLERNKLIGMINS